MNNYNTSVLGVVGKIKYAVIAAVLLILGGFLLLYNNTTHREYEDKTILNTFGKQRMYTQMISKDVNRLYYLMDENEQGNQAKDQINREINKTKTNLIKERDKFASNLEALHNKKIHVEQNTLHINPDVIKNSENLKQIDVIWEDFNDAIQTIVQSKEPSQDFLVAMNRINDMNMELMTLSDKLLTEIYESSIDKDLTVQYVVYSLIVFLFLIIMFALINLERFLVQPFYQLYKGISQIGLSQYPLQPYLPTTKKVKPLVDEIKEMFLKINNLIALIENMNNNNSFMEILTYINMTFSSFIPYNYIGIALMSDDKKMLKASYGVSDDTIVGMPDKVLGVSWFVEETSLGTVLNSGEARIINDLKEHCAGKPLKAYNKALLESGIKASIALPLEVSGEAVGMIFFSSSRANVYTKEHANLLLTLANSIAISLNKNILTNDIIFSSILALAKLSEARDEDTGEHMDRMARYSKLIAQMLYEHDYYQETITLEYIEKIEQFSPLHDIGKVGIVDDILLKPAKLTEEEFAEMKKHAIFGGQVLRAADKNLQKKGKTLFGIGIEIAEGHHEKWDGSGYPSGKKGEEIPLSARIVAIADVFDALTSKRPYKEAFSFETSLNIIAEGRGKHFDPEIVDVFLNNRKRVEDLYLRFNMNKK